ncbi:MAG: hypothetical protein IJZ22_00385 [Bacteroidaceae bacterium]|nr:hypothetical protein [Bacteroidaceae bacterium]
MNRLFSVILFSLLVVVSFESAADMATSSETPKMATLYQSRLSGDFCCTPATGTTEEAPNEDYLASVFSGVSLCARGNVRPDVRLRTMARYALFARYFTKRIDDTKAAVSVCAIDGPVCECQFSDGLFIGYRKLII